MAEDPEMAHNVPLGELLESLRQSGISTDITLVCEGKDFPAHKMILSATSDYFQAMFSTGWDESKSNTVEIPSVGAKEMGIIISFLYTGKMKDVDDQPLLQALLTASHFLQIRSLFKYCYKKLCEGLKYVSFLETCNLAFLYNDEGMITLVLTFLAQHFDEISKSEEFLNLNEAQIQKICQHPDTPITSMDVIINGLFRWAEVEEDREKIIFKILISLDLKRLSNAFLLENLSERALVKRNCHISTLLIGEATRRTLLAVSLRSLKNDNVPKLLAFGEKVVRMYDVKQNQWLAAKTLPFCMHQGMNTVWFGDQVYIFGDEKSYGFSPSATVIKYCPLTNTITFGNIAAPVCYAGAEVIHENIYVVNGANEMRQSVTTVQCYNPVTAICEIRAQTNKPHYRLHVLPFDKHLIILEYWKNENSVERYDPVCDTWTVITNIPGEISRCSAAIHMEKLFVVPIEDTSDFQTYDFTTSKWEQIQLEGSPNKITELHSITMDRSCILLVRDDKNVLHLFDLALNKWVRKADVNNESWHENMTCIV